MYIYIFLVQLLRAFYLAGLRLLLDTAPQTVHYTEPINLKHKESLSFHWVLTWLGLIS